MVSFAEKIAALEAEGYANAPARAKLTDEVDRDTLRRFIALLVFGDEAMRENDFASVRARMRRIFASDTFMRRLSDAGANWLNEPPRKVASKILAFLDALGN